MQFQIEDFIEAENINSEYEAVFYRLNYEKLSKYLETNFQFKVKRPENKGDTYSFSLGTFVIWKFSKGYTVAKDGGTYWYDHKYFKEKDTNKNLQDAINYVLYKVNLTKVSFNI